MVDNTKYCYLQKYKQFDKNYKSLNFRKTAGEQYENQKPVVIFGCSYAYGSKLQEEDTISYKLSKYIGRKVYNRAFPGWGPQDMLYQLKRKDFYQEVVKEEPEYVIYIFMGGHSYRIFREVWTFEVQTFYHNHKGKLEESIFKSGGFLYGYIARKIRYEIGQYLAFNPKNKQFAEDMLISHFTESKKEAQKHWKNTKYVVFVYNYIHTEKETIERLKNEGFEVIFAKDLTNENLDDVKYQISKYDAHPNGKAWELLTPLVAKKLEIEK